MNISWKKFIQCFCGIGFNSRVGLLPKNGGILLSGGKWRMWKGSGLLTQRWMCSQIDGRADVPGGFYCQDYFCCFFPWARGGEFILWGCVPIAVRKKGLAAESCSGVFHADSFMWLCEVAASCMWYRPSSFQSNHRVWLEKGGFRNNQFLQSRDPALFCLLQA